MLSLLLAFGVAACGAGDAPSPDEAVASAQSAVTDEVLEGLASIPGLTGVSEKPSNIPGTRFFVLQFEQPIDHDAPNGPRFTQKIALLHRSFGAPTSLLTGGYAVNTKKVIENEATAMLQANQLYVEHRYYGDSVPSGPQYEHLDIEQSAGDHHRIVQAFRPVYTGRWISGGTSKGGMTSIYHRYYYPDDVDGTIAYVSPSTYSASDPRYVKFIRNVGNAALRAKLIAYQRELLIRREQLVPMMEAKVAQWGLTFDVVGADRAFEFGALEASFFFWQLCPVTMCEPLLPAPDASDEELVDFYVNWIGAPFNYDDETINVHYGPYFYQSATQLGHPRFDEAPLMDLLRYPGQDIAANLTPVPVTIPFSHGLMAKIEAKTRAHGERMLFIYGENDPWSTNKFEGKAKNDAFQFVVPGGAHNVRIADLPEEDRLHALSRIFAWADVPFDPALARTAAPLAPEAYEDEAPGPFSRLPPR
ncbi:S28 family serine protease [Polyangium aurulentum]|uniref:S28 family serine protease n=1 Tax=Polyangium aurulentum TaxID=2567896 RepID=UPI00146ED8BF|nr:S28 family serine protease [Polyangium aurulentum]UQA57883.1 hypothetical protein E8A73_042515 [Polyangium aurulentum]